jgi:hypothetical protein
MHKHFFQSKMFLDISKEEEDTETALIDQTVNQMKGTNWPIQLTVVIWHLDLIAGLTNQKLNTIIVKRKVIMLWIAGVQLSRLRRMQILW